MPAYDQIDNHACTLKRSLSETSKRTVTSGETCKRENNIPWNDKKMQWLLVNLNLKSGK